MACDPSSKSQFFALLNSGHFKIYGASFFSLMEVDGEERMTELTPEQVREQALREFNIRTAERAHDERAAYARAMQKTVMKDAWGVIRNLILINGGAAISILTFVGALAARASTQPAQLSAISRGLVLFAVGVVAATVTAALSYLTNYCYGEATNWESRDNVHPYNHPTPRTRRFTKFGRICHVVALLCVIVSLVCFVWGVIVVARAVAKG